MATLTDERNIVESRCRCDRSGLAKVVDAGARAGPGNHRRRHYAVIGAAISVNSSSPACLSFPGPALLPSVLVELQGSINFKENLCEFSAGSFNVIIF